MASPGLVTSPEERRLALERVLASSTFARSEKLKRVLRFLCDMEIAGKGGDVSEYAIGVQALGRPASFSPGEDSIVRSTAYVLRQKLQEFYRKEAPAAPVRIEFHPGSYVPVFVDAGECPAALEPPRSPSAAQKSYVRAAAFFLLGALAATLVVVGWQVKAKTYSPGKSVVAEAWGPLGRPNSKVLLIVGNPGHFLVRQFPVGRQPPTPFTFLVPPEAYERFPVLRGQAPLAPDTGLYMYPTGNSALMGDAIAVAEAARTITQLGGTFEVLPERTMRVAAMGASNFLLIGNPEYSAAVASLLADTPFSMSYNPATGAGEIVEPRAPQGAPRAYSSSAPDYRYEGVAYGLITVKPSLRSEGRLYRTIGISGVNSAGAQGAVEYFSSPAKLNEFRRELQKSGLSDFPAAYQLLVKCRTDSSVPISTSYVTHRLLK